MLIKSNSLRILLIYCDFIDRKCFHAILNEFLADPLFAEFWRNKEHFNLSVFYAHKTNRESFSIFSNYQMGNFL